MTKEVDVKNQIWFEKDGKVIRLGLTRNFLETLTECWHILPSNMKQIKQKAPLLTIESNDGLISLLSPVTGNLYNWDNKAANFPEKLTEEDVIVTLTSEEIVSKGTGPTLEAREAARQRLMEQGIITAPAQAVFGGGGGGVVNNTRPVENHQQMMNRLFNEAMLNRRPRANPAPVPVQPRLQTPRVWAEIPQVIVDDPFGE